MKNICKPKDIYDLLRMEEVSSTVEPLLQGYAWDGYLYEMPSDYVKQSSGGKCKISDSLLKEQNHFTLLLTRNSDKDERLIDVTVTPLRFYINDFDCGNRDFSKLWRKLLKKRHTKEFYRCKLIYKRGQLNFLVEKLSHLNPNSIRTIAETNMEIESIKSSIVQLESLIHSLEAQEHSICDSFLGR